MDIQYTPMSGLIRDPRLYSPLYVCLVDQESHEVVDALYNYAAEYCEDIRQAIASFHTPKYPGGDLMRYFTLPDDPEMEHTIRQKVKSARLSARPEGEFLYTELGLDMTDDLTVQELEAFVEQIESQYRDGIGAELELHDFLTAGGELLCFRLGHDGLVFMTGTAFEEMQINAQVEAQGAGREGSTHRQFDMTGPSMRQ